MAFTTKLNLNNGKFSQTGTLTLAGQNDFTGVVNLSAATTVNADSSTFFVDGQAFNTYTGNTTTANNGLTLNGENISLGGILTGNTSINTANLYGVGIGAAVTPTGINSFATGLITQATGNNSHAEGQQTQGIGNNSHAEGSLNIASGLSSHAEGTITKAYGDSSHAEGCQTFTYGSGSHAEGCSTMACGNFSHSGGYGVNNREVLTNGLGSFNHSQNTAGQTDNHGALANRSAILGGLNHNIEAGNTGAAIIGGNTIKLTGTSYIDTTAVSKLAIFNTPADDADGEVLVWDSTSKIVGKTTIAALGGLSGGTNGLSTSGNDVILGGTLDQTTTIDGDSNILNINNGVINISDNTNVVISTTGASSVLELNAKSNGQAVIKSQSGTLAGDDFTNAVGFNLDYNASLFSVTDNRATAAGLQYVDDYSSDFTNRSLVDKAYVDAVASGLDVKDSSVLASTVNIDLTGGTFSSGSTIDGIIVNDGWRVLMRAQTDAIENGIYDYVAASSGFTRSEDFDGTPSNEVSQGAFTRVITGDTLGATSWVLTTPDPITVGVTELDFTLFSTPVGIVDGTGTTVTSIGTDKAISIELSANSGLDFDAAGSTGRLRVASSIAGLGLDLGSGILDADVVTGASMNSSTLELSKTVGGDVTVDLSQFDNVTTTANNGLTKTGDNITLGGTLTGNTLIDGTSDIEFNTLNAASFKYSNLKLDNSSSNATIQTLNFSNLNATQLIVDDDSFNVLSLIGGNPANSTSILLNNDSLNMTVLNTGSQSGIKIDYSGITISDSFTNTGLLYDDDYSVSGITNPRWIPDYAAVIDLTSAAASATTANNGLTKTGDNITFGGTLTGNTTIDFDGNGLIFGSGSSITNTLNVNNLAIATTPDTGTTSDSVLVRNSVTGIIKTVEGSELGDANNIYDITGVTTTTLTGSEYVVLVQTSGGTQTITLPAAPANRQAFKIKDKGNALTNIITVSGNGKNIDGSPNATINTDYGALELVYSLSDDEWYSLAFIN